MEAETKKTRDSDKDADILKRAHENSRLWYEYFRDNNRRAAKDSKFAMMEEKQWPQRERRTLKSLNKPVLSFNRTANSIEMIEGQYKRFGASIVVLNDDNDSTQNKENDILDLYAGLTRSIAYNSKAKTKYGKAFHQQLVYGYGVLRVTRDYEDKSAFKQCLKINAERSPINCFFDPNAEEVTKEDGKFCGSISYFKKEEIKKRWGVESPKSFQLPNIAIGPFKDVRNPDDICVCEYSERVYVKREYALLSDQREMPVDDAKEAIKKSKKAFKAEMEEYEASAIMGMQQTAPPPQQEELKIEETAFKDDYDIIVYKMLDNEILEEVEWGSRFLPLIFADGHSTELEGKQYIRTFVTYVKDAERFINYLGSAIADNLINGQAETVVMDQRQMPDKKEEQAKWYDKSKNHGVLLKKSIPAIPEPMFKPASEIPITYINMFNQLQNTYQQITGIYDANVGAPAQEVSGVAKNAMIGQALLSYYSCFDNNLKAIEQAGRVIIDLIPFVYDSERVVSTMSQRGDTKNVTINARSKDKMGYENEITRGNYSVIVKAGPSYEAQKEAERDFLVSLMQLEGPNAMSKYGDLLAATTNVEITDELVERSKYGLDPLILLEEDPEFFKKMLKKGQALQAIQGPNPQTQIQQQELKNETTRADAADKSATAKLMEAGSTVHEASKSDDKTQIRAAAETHKVNVESGTEMVKVAHDHDKKRLSHENDMLKDVVQHFATNRFGDANMQQ